MPEYMEFRRQQAEIAKKKAKEKDAAKKGKMTTWEVSDAEK